jgi:hypothetical protein
MRNSQEQHPALHPQEQVQPRTEAEPAPQNPGYEQQWSVQRRKQQQMKPAHQRAGTSGPTRRKAVRDCMV